MCGGSEHSKPQSREVDFHGDHEKTVPFEKQLCKVQGAGMYFSILLELAANNDLIGFKQAVEEDGSAIDEISFWYGRQNGSKQMCLEQRTPLIIAALYGSIDVLNYILPAYAMCGIDVNLECGSGKDTALHCAAAGGSSFAIEAVKLLLQSGADVNHLDANGKRPVDVLMVSPKLSNGKATLEFMLSSGCQASSFMKIPSQVSDNGSSLSHIGSEIYKDLHGEGPNSRGSSPPLSLSPKELSSKLFSTSLKFPEASRGCVGSNEKKEYPVDPSFPDIKNDMYSTDEFRMYSFKVKPCSRAYSHVWTECPFAHPGENARRRDPRRYHYSCVPCLEFRKGSCRRGDGCEYAHGVFECWLHPAQYRTRLCKDETKCTRRVCFFAHRPEELRPLSVLTGSTVHSPQVAASLDMNSTMSPIMLSSPSSMLKMSAVSPSNTPPGGLTTPPMSPSSSKSLPTGRAGVALSADGLAFRRHRGPLPNGAVFDPSDDPAAFDSVHVAVSDAVYSGGKWLFYYFGGGMLELPLVGKPQEKHRGVRLLPGVAYSDDGFLFPERRGPLLDVGKPGFWDENGVSWPRVFPGDGKLFMTYHTRESGGPAGMGFFSAGLAVSGDGKSWEKIGKILSVGEPGSWDEGGVSVRHVIRVGDEYVMFYEGSNYRFEFAIGLAVSKDGVTWQKDMECGREPGGPILTARTGKDVWDNVIVGTPYVLPMLDGTFRMYYLGVGTTKVNGEVTTQQGIGLAVSDGANFRLWQRYGC